jgi:MoxR-like ATPase
MNEREYLEAANIIKLQSAARMAGIRWKSGTLDKEGIIARLMASPSMMRACIATLQRMERGDMPAPVKPAGSLLDDLQDEMDADSPAPAPVPASGIDAAMLRDYVKQVERAQDMATLGRTFTEIRGNIADVCKTLEVFATSLQALQTARPIQINIPERKPITIRPAEHHESFATLITYLEVNRRVILQGEAGTGKSLAAKNAAEALGVRFLLLPPVTMSHELIGHRDANGHFHGTPLTDAYDNGGLLLVDEADASSPDALLTANPVFDGNGFATFGDGKLHEQHPDFYVIFNMNTDGTGATLKHAGRNPLDGATSARFGVRINWGIDARIETRMAQGQTAWHEAIRAIRAWMIQRDIQEVNATPRHLKAGAGLLNAGVARAQILADCLKWGAVGENWNDVTRLPAVRSFLGA